MQLDIFGNIEKVNEVLTVSMVANLVNKGISFEVKDGEFVFIECLDIQKRYKKQIFGSGFLLSEKAAAEKAAAEKAAAEKENYIEFELSEREKKVVKSLNI